MGHIRDKSTGLTYMQARYYDPVIGRFLAEDPVGVLDNGLLPQQFNRYAYTWNDPINAHDPDGEFLNLAPALAGAIGGGLVGALVAGGTSLAKGEGIRTALAQASVGAVSGAITGAVIGSGAGLVAVVTTGGLYGAGSGAVGTVISNSAAGTETTLTDLAIGTTAGLVSGAVPIPGTPGNGVLKEFGESVLGDVFKNEVTGRAGAAIDDLIDDEEEELIEDEEIENPGG